ncbi:MAG: hypothetical protein NC548_15715 [Lachnospiraceae bacterium]|nr:hypothetical protein [Lachnospiraceae bacterium]
MDKTFVRRNLDAIKAAGITSYRIYFNNSYYVNVNEAEQCYFDDAKETVYCFKTAVGAQPKDPRPIALDIHPYELIERFSIPTDYNGIMRLVKEYGLNLTEDLTQFIKKASSQTGLYPVQSTPTVDEEGNPIQPDQMGFVPSVRSSL